MKTQFNTADDNIARKAALSVNEFCLSYGISRALFYVLLREGTAPRVMRVRGRLLISTDAAKDWQRQAEGVQA